MTNRQWQIGQWRNEVRPEVSRAGDSLAVDSDNLLPQGRLLAGEQGLNEFALPADNEMIEGLKPVAYRHFGVGIEPVAQRDKVLGGNLARPSPVCQVIQ